MPTQMDIDVFFLWIVQESIALLMACRRFSIEGADTTIRKMLPLIFSREQGARLAGQLAHSCWLGSCGSIPFSSLWGILCHCVYSRPHEAATH